MELRQLEAFAAVMSTGSVTAAGRLLGRSQPAISRLLQELEAEIGYALFLRSGPRVTPTDQGFLLYEDVERALASLREIRSRAKDIARDAGRPLRVAATSALAVGLIPEAVRRVEARTGPGAMQILGMTPERVVHAVLTGAVQLGATSLPLEHRGLDVHWIGQAPCAVALPADDPAAARPVVALHEMAQRRLITMANPYRLRHRLDQALAQAGGNSANIIETNSSTYALGAVRAGLGVAVLEPVTAYGAPMQGVTIRPLDVDIPFYFGVISPQAKPLTTLADDLAQALAQAAAALLPGFVRHEASQHGALLQSVYDHVPPSTETLP
ncbi:LysR family transcriptional regulator [Bordetella sp. FB-8]|uniref:LysR family transcriptional regulator n=1 Tax=Bordetella sp. FB-8 TaxID=1159870 RepID=UPI00037FDF2F|nr:LysR family transcriptional regulator [Bordetella sp. FB-8]